MARLPPWLPLSPVSSGQTVPLACLFPECPAQGLGARGPSGSVPGVSVPPPARVGVHAVSAAAPATNELGCLLGEVLFILE